MDEWLLSWLARTAETLVGQAPRAAARHHDLSGWLADALCRVGDFAEAEQVARRALLQDAEPDVLAGLYGTLAQCSMRAGRSAESLPLLSRAMAAPGISAAHRARLLALAARTHCNCGEAGKAGRVAATALRAASGAGDSWATGWALHALTTVTSVQGQPAQALALLDRVLAVTRADPALTDLGLRLQVDKSVILGSLGRCEEAFAAARQAQRLAGQAGAAVRLAQAHGALTRLLFETGRWDEAIAEAQILHEVLKEPAVACSDLGIAAVICLHRGEAAAARRHLAAAAPHAERVGSRVIAPLALARSLNCEQDDAQPEALAVLMAGLGGSTGEIGEAGDLLADAVRLATATGDPGTASALAGQAAAFAAGSEILCWQAGALYCRGLAGHDAACLLRAAERYGEASRTLLAAQAPEAAAGEFVSSDDRDQARAAFNRALELGDPDRGPDGHRWGGRGRAGGLGVERSDRGRGCGITMCGGACRRGAGLSRRILPDRAFTKAVAEAGKSARPRSRHGPRSPASGGQLPAQDGDLVPQYQDLRVFRSVAPGEEVPAGRRS